MSWARGIRILCLSGLLGLPAAGQQPAEHFRAPAPPNQAKTPNSNNPNRGGAKPGGKMGDWLQKHKNLPPDQQEKLLENDPSFKNLPPQRQQELKERLRKFNNLPPAQRERALNRMQYIASLSPPQRQQIRGANQQLQALPQDRQVMVHKALRHLRQMNPQEREQVLNSERFKSTFSQQEQSIVKQLSAINPQESANGGASPQPGGQPK